MIAFIRARFPNTAASQIWSDTVANNWMDPSIPFSLAHYWKQSTFQQVDLSYFLFPPVVVTDPRQGKEYKADHKACWKRFDRVDERPRDPKPGPRIPGIDQIGLPELIRVLSTRDPRSAYAIAAEVARKAGVPTE